MTKPFGNLSFDEYTFDTATEKLVVALQAAMKIGGYTEKSPSWRKLQRLKKALKKDKRYTFILLSKEKVASEPLEKAGPEHDLSPLLSEIVSHCLGVKLRKFSSKNTSAGYGVVTVICAGPLEDLCIGPDHTVTEDRFKSEVVERCFLQDKRFSSVRVMTVAVKKSKKKKYCLVTVGVVYK